MCVQRMTRNECNYRSAAEKSEFGLCGVVGGMTVIVMLGYTMRLLRGGIAAVGIVPMMKGA